jgi:hypothetical protein
VEEDGLPVQSQLAHVGVDDDQAAESAVGLCVEAGRKGVSDLNTFLRDWLI